MVNKSSPFRIFSNRKYCLYFGGQLISQIGTWMQQVALGWFTYTLTGSAFLLAVVGASSQIPALIVMPFAGVFADRYDRHKMVIATQTLAMIQAGILAYVTLTHQAQVWHLVALGMFAGLITSFDMPTRTAFVYDLVERQEDLPSTIAMNSTLFNITRLIGPALAGFVVAALGTGMCFLINAISYIAVIVALFFIGGNFKPKREQTGNVISQLKDGFGYVFRTTPVRALILYLAIFGMGGMSYALLLPVFVKNIGGNANTLGYLMSASAVGSLVGSFMLSARTSVIGLGRWIVISSFAFSLALIVFSFASNFWLAALVLAVIGLCMMIQMASINTILQTIIEDDKRGRVMSLFTMAFLGTAPIGSLLAGAIANHFGLQVTLFGCGIYCLIVAALFTSQLPRIRAETRPIYIQKGLLEAENETNLLSGEGAV